MQKDECIYVAGHDGMVGSAVVRALVARGYERVIGRPIDQLDLRNTTRVRDFFDAERPKYVIFAAARVGGIQANMNHPAEFLHDNLMMQCNVIHQALLHEVRKLCFLGSSCIYPRDCPQPMREEYLLTGPLEPTNEGYAIAKIAGLKMVEYYRRQYGLSGVSLMPCNLYGTNDHFDLENAHVLSALVRRFVDAVDDRANAVTVWGTGSARREFMHVDDAARAVLFAMEGYDAPEMLNVGWGEDVSIKELAETVAGIAGFTGNLEWDRTKPDGMPRKCMDVSRMRALGFAPRITLREGIERTIREYRALKVARAEI
ncbi:MAG: GDP-L-fucose synthase [Polyangiaceae bacterium]|nr:GDP-L-fucose synthase [Polyangiaceae bacterium]